MWYYVSNNCIFINYLLNKKEKSFQINTQYPNRVDHNSRPLCAYNKLYIFIQLWYLLHVKSHYCLGTYGLDVKSSTVKWGDWDEILKNTTLTYDALKIVH